MSWRLTDCVGLSEHSQNNDYISHFAVFTQKIKLGNWQAWTTEKSYVVLMSSRKGKGFILK